MTITEEQKARMERNRQEALERRARMESQEPATAQMAGERENDKNAEQAGASTGDLQEQTNGTGIEAKHDSGQKILTASSKEAPAPPASVVSNLLDELLARRSCAAAREAVGRYELLDKALQHDGGADDFKEAMVSRLDDIIACCCGHILSGDEECVVHALKLAGRISNNVELCRDLSGASIKNLVAAIARLAAETNSKKVKILLLWFIAMQQYSKAQAAKVATAMLTAVCEATRNDTGKAVQAEGIRALERLLAQFPPKILLQNSAISADKGTDGGWWRVVFSNFVHTNNSVRQGALGLADRAVSLMNELELEARGHLNEAAVSELMAQDGILAKLSHMLQGKREAKDWLKDADSESLARSAATAMGWMARFAEAKLVKDGHIHAFNKVMELPFAHKAPSVREEAFKSWFQLACVFDNMNSTLAHPKRLEVICRPFRNSWPNDESVDVRRTAAITWSHVVHLLTRRCSIEKTSTFEVAVSSVLSSVLCEKDHGLRALLMDIVGCLLHTRTDMNNGAPSSMLLVSDAPATNLTLRLDFIMAKSKFFFDLLLELRLTDEKKEHELAEQLWTCFMARLAVEEESRDSVESLMRAAVQFWTGCLLGSRTQDVAMCRRRTAVLQIVRQVCAQPSAARLLFCTSISLQYTVDTAVPAEGITDSQTKVGADVGQIQIKLAPYLAGAVSIAALHEPELSAHILQKILDVFPADPRSYRQLFEVVEHMASIKEITQDFAMPVRFWVKASTAYSASLEASRHVMSSPAQAKIQTPVLTLGLAQVFRLLAALTEDVVAADCMKELEKQWVVLFDQLREATKSKSNGHGLAAAVRVSAAMCKSLTGSLDSLSIVGLQHLDFVLGVMFDDGILEMAVGSKSKPAQSDARAVLQASVDHPLQSISELWASAFRCTYRAFEEKRVECTLLKSVIARLLPILDHTFAVGMQYNLLVVLIAPVSKCLAACSRPGNESKGSLHLGRPGADGIADEVELAWSKVVETVLKNASHKDLGSLSPLLVSALSNTNPKIQNKAVECWNSTLGNYSDSSELPATLLYVLKKLSKRVHINLPQNADERASPTSNEESQTSLPTQSQEAFILTKSPARLMSTQPSGKGSLLPSKKRAGSRPGSLHNTPSRSPGKACISSEGKTEVKAEGQMFQEARDVDYVQIANAKRKLLLTEHQREARKEARTGAGGLSYTSLEDPESRMAGVEGEMLLMPSDSRTQWSENTMD